MIVKRNRILDESPPRLVENNSSNLERDVIMFGDSRRDVPHERRPLGDEENDEENIVIDIADDDDDDEDEDEDESGAGAQADVVTIAARLASAQRDNSKAAEGSLSSSADSQHQDADSDPRKGRQRFSVGDLIWFDPNQLGYAIPGKVLDFYPELNVLTVEGCCQPLALEDPQLDEATRNRLLAKADEQLQVYELSSDLQSFKSVRTRLPIGSQAGVSNLAELEELSTESIIWNLKLRFKQNLIYTKCGHKILVSVNPYKQLSELYNLDQVNQYDTIKNQPKLANLDYLAHNKFIRWLTLEGGQSGAAASHNPNLVEDDPSQSRLKKSPITIKAASPPPHIFELANEALKKLLVASQNQCFVLLGDSSSGKTEAAKLLVQYFATVNKSPTNLMTEQILESIQMLESFGNAKTVLNNNSSRFGKLLEIRFSLVNGFIQDARTVDLNLLDRSRIVCQNEGERNFNIFYELLAGLSKGEKEKYGLQTADKYFYLNQGHCVEMEQKDDGEDFRALLASMQVLGLTYEEQDTIFRVLATILHLGNIYFHRKVLAVRTGIGGAGSGPREPHLDETKPNNDGGVEGVEIGSDTEARWVSHLLQVQFDLVMRCLTARTVEVPGQQLQQQHRTERGAAPVQPPSTDSIATPLNIDQALDTRDAIARALYTCLFKWLVQRINLMINASASSNNEKVSLTRDEMDCSSEQKAAQEEEPIYLCRTSESLCEFQPDKLVANRRPQPARPTLGRPQQTALISILDAFGFENLAENNFEQLCINYAAELLHYHTNRYLVRMEQAEYARERIKWLPMGASHADLTSAGTNSFSSSSTPRLVDNSSAGRNKQAAAIVNLISKKPLGILNLLDDECNFPKATDQSFAEKCHHNHALNENYQCARLVANCQEFGIRHFRQANRMVWYQVDGFVEKNRDSLRPDVMELLLGSKMTLVADMLRKIHKPFGSSVSVPGGGDQSVYASSSTGKTLSRTYDGRYVSMKPRAGTVAARFHDTLNNNRVIETLSLGTSQSGCRVDGSQTTLLMNGIYNNNNNNIHNHNNNNNNNYITRSELSSHLSGETNQDRASFRRQSSSPANTWFIVCLKPNRTKSADVFDVAYVQDQVRSMNLLELVHMRKFGYPVRLRYADFLKRYKCLVSRKFLATSCGRHLKSLGGQLDKLIHSASSLDRTSERDDSVKRAMRNVCGAILELKLAELQPVAELHNHENQQSQEQHRHFQCGLHKMFLSEWLFHCLEQKRFVQYKRSIEIIQKTWTMWLVRREFLEQRRAATVIQANLRGLLARRQFLNEYSLIVSVQRRWRRRLLERRARHLEARRRELKMRQQQQLKEFQAQQSKLANQLRFRLQPSARATDKTLDIPEDLAQLYRLQRNWLPMHDLTNVREFDLAKVARLAPQSRRPARRRNDPSDGSASIPFLVPFGCATAEDVADERLQEISHRTREFIEQLELDERYSTHALLTRYFSNQTPQFGYSRLPITRPFSWPQMMRFKRLALRRVRRDAARLQVGASLKHSTAALKEQSVQQRFMALEQKAVAVYKLILRFIDSDQVFKLPDDHAGSQANEDESRIMLQRLLKFKLISDYINYLCLVEPLLRDEVYLQLISQTWQNPKLASQENCWKLLLNCLACFDPLDRRLTKHMLSYASDNCCSSYRQLLCERLFEAHERLSEVAKHLGGSRRVKLAAVNSTSLANQRQFPTTVLEYWANQEASHRLSIAGSCYADDNVVEATMAAGDNDNEAENGRDLGKLNSARTVAIVSPRSTAEQLAHQLLLPRGLPDANLSGWSVEIQHEGAMSEFSSRLRGDDHLFDHFARLELLPELVQLIDDDLEALECEQLDELGLGIGHDEDDATHAELDPSAAPAGAEYGVPDCCRDSPPPTEECCREEMNHANYAADPGYQRLSVQSRRSWDLQDANRSPLSSYRAHRRSAAMSELDLQTADTGMYNTGHQYDSDYYGQHPTNYERQQAQMYQHGPSQPYRGQGNLHRRSMSMQELLLASSSALNGRYFMQQHSIGPNENAQFGAPAHHYASSCLSSQCCAPATQTGGYLPRSRRHSGSLRQLDSARRGQGSQVSAAAYHQSRRRSTTPNSMVSAARLSASSAYGSHGSRFNANQYNLEARVQQSPSGYMSNAVANDAHHQLRRQQEERHGRTRPRLNQANNKAAAADPHLAWSHRSNSASSHDLNAHSKPLSDYASAQSDYEQLGHHQQRSVGRSAALLDNERQAEVPTRARNQKPTKKSTNALREQQQQQQQLQRHNANNVAASLHYAATSSAMSDTSEAPSLASHVRAVKVPQPNGDLDQYLDDLFNPLLDGADLDEMSDARSMATSIRGANLNVLCNAEELSRAIRGTDDDSNLANENTEEDQPHRPLQQEQPPRSHTLSPTFESLLKSLKSVNESELTTGGDPAASGNRQSAPTNLEELNLSQLKALNEKLESEIQAAQSARASLELTGTTSGCFTAGIEGDFTEAPIPPPLPSFDHHHQLSTSAQQAEQMIEDIYSRAKTIRIGKWRWPPALNEPQQLVESEQSDQTTSTGREERPVSLAELEARMSDTQQVSDLKRDDTQADDDHQQQEIYVSSASVGRLKISSEMKAKLEQLTNTAGPAESPYGHAGRQEAAAKSSQESSDGGQPPKRLDEQRRKLLASQLLGAQSSTRTSTPVEGSSSRRDSGLLVSGTKVLAVKQQLAAAAGVALSVLDSTHSGASSQMSSRRESGCHPAANSEQQRRLVLEADELGPQSRGAITQRHAFYLDDDGKRLVNHAHHESKDEPSLQANKLTPQQAKATSRPPLEEPKNLNLCLLKHKQEITQANTAGDERSREARVGQWVSSNSDKDYEDEEAQFGRRQEGANLEKHHFQGSAVGRGKTADQVGAKRRRNEHEQERQAIACFAYANVDWQVRVRKEVFMPSENYDDEQVVQLVFAQLVADVMNPRHWTRLNNKERAAIKSIMKDNSVGVGRTLPGLGQLQPVKRELIRLARSFGLYFTRSYQALNFACLSENYLDSTVEEPADFDNDSLESDEFDGDSSSSANSTSDDESLLANEECNNGQNPSRAPFSTRLALRLARRLRNADKLGLEWIDMVALHHSGLRLVALVCEQQPDQRPADRTSIRNSKQFIANQFGQSGANGGGPPTPPIGYKVLETLKFRDMTDVRLVGGRVLLVSMRSYSIANGAGGAARQPRHKSWLISSSQANQLTSLLRSFLADYNTNVRAGGKSAASQASKLKGETQRISSSSQAGKHSNAGNHHSESRSKNRPNRRLASELTEREPRNKRENALLASDDAHDGDHLEQRQAPDRVDKLRPAANPNNVLADAQRALSNDLANTYATPAPADTSCSGHLGAGEQSSRGGSGARGKHRNKQRAPHEHQPIPDSQPPTADLKQRLPHEQRSGGSRRSAGSRSSAASSSGKRRREPGGGPDAGRGRPDSYSPATPTGGQSDQQQQQQQPRHQQPGESADGEPSDDGSRRQLTRAQPAGKRSSSAIKQPGGPSMWQNSLSRMSNRFSLFSGVHLSAASTFKQQFGKRSKKRPSGELAQDSNANADEQPAVVLDAWIEAKMDFDGEEDDLHVQPQEDATQPSAEPAEDREKDNHHQRKGNKSAPTSRRDSTTTGSDQGNYGSLVAGSDEDNNNNNGNDGAARTSKADDGKYSMLQFALYNFREAIEKYSLETRLSVNNKNNNNNNNEEDDDQNGTKQFKSAHDDWSTLRGSLKLIESLRSNASCAPNANSDQSTVGSTKTLTRLTSAEQAHSQQAPGDWTWRELAQMVKFTSAPLKRSLLKLVDHQQAASAYELDKRAVDCFAAIMRYMGDLPSRSEGGAKSSSGGKQLLKHVPDNEVECVYLILINCHNHPQLRDEIYCQLIKQTTNNRSARPDSCLRGWRLFSLLAAYFDCSAHFRPYLLNYLEQNAFDKRRSYHSIALLCLQNLRKTFKYGGRKNVPSIEEIAALSAGRISKRQIYRLPGGTERVINTKSTTVVDDIIHEICSNMLMISQPNEMLEFSLYCIADGDLYTMPLNRDEYILDITTELIKNHQQYFLIFCRSIWHYPLRLDSKLYIEVTFNQIAPDYLEGLLLVLPRQKRSSGTGGHYSSASSTSSPPRGGAQQQPLRLSGKLIREIARLAALLHRASSTDYVPHKDEIKYLLPRPIVAAMKQQHKNSSSSSSEPATGRGSRGQAQEAAVPNSDQLIDEPLPDQQTWTALVQDYWREMSAFDTLDAKAQFLDIVRHWPLFGSSFFAIKLIQRDLIQPTDYILALNKLGIQMLDTQTHETHRKYSFNEVVSTRKVRSEDGALYLDMKCGNLLKRTIIRIQTDQAHEISRLVRQYIDIELLQASSKQQATQSQQQQQQASDDGSSLSNAVDEIPDVRFNNAA